MIDEATEIAGTKSYIRFKQRNRLKLDGAMETIILDLAALPVEEVEIQTVKDEIEKSKGVTDGKK
jgi:hypothetical protein